MSSLSFISSTGSSSISNNSGSSRDGLVNCESGQGKYPSTLNWEIGQIPEDQTGQVSSAMGISLVSWKERTQLSDEDNLKSCLANQSTPKRDWSGLS